MTVSDLQSPTAERVDPEVTHIATCSLCEAMCGVEITTRGSEVVRIKPNKRDVFSKGAICPKATVLGHLHTDPTRLTKPVVRDGDTFREVSWDEAFERCEQVMHPILETYGIKAVTAFVGNMAAHTFAIGRYLGMLIGMSGIPYIYSSGTVDQWPKNVSSALMYGDMWHIPVPDLQRSNFVVLLGANPQASNGSLMGCPNVLGELDRIKAEGGKVIVIDPRRSGTAKHATDYIPILPGTDAVLLLAVVHVLFAEGLVNLNGLAEKINGLDDLQRAAADFTPELAEPACRIPAERIRQLAVEIAEADRGVVYGRIGTCNQEFGTLASWLIDVVNILTGNFDTPGGLMWPTPVNWAMFALPTPKAPGTSGSRTPIEFGRWRTRVRDAPEVFGQVPASCMAEEIDTPGEGQLKGLITVSGNPVLSAPGADRLEKALPLLDGMISIDNWINETTCHADVILPGLSPLEQPHFDDLMWNFAVRNAGKWSGTVFPPVDGRPEEWEVILRLAAIMMGKKNADTDVAAMDDGWFSFMLATLGLDPSEILPLYDEGGPERTLDLTIRTGNYGDWYGAKPDGINLQSFKDNPDGIDFGPMVPRIDDKICTHTGKLEIAPPYILGDLPRLLARLERPADELVMVTRRHLRSKNSWMHQSPTLVGGTNRCTLMMNPEDAERSAVHHGDTVRVTSEVGSLDIELEVTADMMLGVCSMPHGWGHTVKGAQTGVPEGKEGVNMNRLTPSHRVDVLSNNAVVNGFPVWVARLT
jgi:anaerobic selenocysteine-containing dehydrogenase